VGSSSLEVSGSSLSLVTMLVPDSVPWLEIWVTFGGKDLLTVTLKVIVTLPPAFIVIRFTETAVSPLLFPVTTDPLVVVTLPTTRVVLASGESEKVSPESADLLELIITTVDGLFGIERMPLSNSE